MELLSFLRIRTFFKAYHVESGEWIGVDFTIFAATSFNDNDLKLYYRSDSNQDSFYVISVDDASSFTTCPMDNGEKCLTTDNEIELLEYIDETSNLLYMSIENTYEFPEHETLEDSKTIDNADSFVSSDANIASVVRVFERGESNELEINFNVEADNFTSELSTLEWSTFPIPPGGIADSSSEQQILSSWKTPD